MKHSKADFGRSIEAWGTADLTEGQFLSEYRRCGRDGAFQVHLAQRHMLILFHKVARPICEPILDGLTRVLARG